MNRRFLACGVTAFAMPTRGQLTPATSQSIGTYMLVSWYNGYVCRVEREASDGGFASLGARRLLRHLQHRAARAVEDDCEIRDDERSVDAAKRDERAVEGPGM